MDKQEALFIAGGISMIILVLGGIFAIGMFFSSVACKAKWENSGFVTDFGPIKGCLISKDGTTWIPANNYREIK